MHAKVAVVTFKLIDKLQGASGSHTFNHYFQQSLPAATATMTHKYQKTFNKIKGTYFSDNS